MRNLACIPVLLAMISCSSNGDGVETRISGWRDRFQAAGTTDAKLQVCKELSSCGVLAVGGEVGVLERIFETNLRVQAMPHRERMGVATIIVEWPRRVSVIPRNPEAKNEFAPPEPVTGAHYYIEFNDKKFVTSILFSTTVK